MVLVVSIVIISTLRINVKREPVESKISVSADDDGAQSILLGD